MINKIYIQLENFDKNVVRLESFDQEYIIPLFVGKNDLDLIIDNFNNLIKNDNKSYFLYIIRAINNNRISDFGIFLSDEQLMIKF
jgi:hypothetical protein